MMTLSTERYDDPLNLNITAEHNKREVGIGTIPHKQINAAETQRQTMVFSNEKRVVRLSCLAIFAISAISIVNEIIYLEDNDTLVTGRRSLKSTGRGKRSLCTNSECMQPDPPDVTALGMYRGLAHFLSAKDCNEHEQCTIAYVVVPKSGSTTVKNAMEESIHDSEIGYLSPEDGTEATQFNPFIFTVLRDPRKRIVSAYSTLLARESRYGLVNGKDYFLPKPPDDTTNTFLWKQHFRLSLHQMLSMVKSLGWENRPSIDSHWNEHIVPQVEWIKGLNVSHIGCVDSMSDVLTKYGLSEPSKDNHYEHNITTMPKEKYASYDLLDDETKALILELYDEDIKLFESTCVIEDREDTKL